MNEPLTDPVAQNRRRIRLISSLRAFGIILALYVLIAYLVVPAAWIRTERRHPALDTAPHITHTKSGIPGDPLNVALVGSESQLVKSMLSVGWYAADPITLRSSLRIAGDTVLRRPYDDAPVSNLYVWGRKEDLAFEQPIGNDPRRRHHVRFWNSPQLDDQGRLLWIGGATLDTRVGFSHTTGEITHHISPDVDAERDKVIADLQQAGRLESAYWEDNFQPQLQGRNGGGDPWHTDGRLEVGVLADNAAIPLDKKSDASPTDPTNIQPNEDTRPVEQK